MAEYFNVLRLHRNDILMAFEVESHDAKTSEDCTRLIKEVESLTDGQMRYIANKLGECMLDGGDYYNTKIIIIL
jgi:hypothetical protein